MTFVWPTPLARDGGWHSSPVTGNVWPRVAVRRELPYIDAGAIMCLDVRKHPCDDVLMTITVNGESTDVPDSCTVSRLLEILDKNPKFLAVERNLELVPRKAHAEAVLCPGDRLEIVTLVGGG